MKRPKPLQHQVANDSVLAGTRYVDKTAGTDVSVLAVQQQQQESSYYHSLLDVLLQTRPEPAVGAGIDAQPGVHEGSALELLLGHFCPAYHNYLRSYLELAHSVTGLGAVRLGIETEVFLKALLALQQLISRPAETTRASQSGPGTVSLSSTDIPTLKLWIQTCRPSHDFAFSFSESQETLLGSLSLLQRLIIQNLVFSVLAWSTEGKQLTVEFQKVQRASTGNEFLSLKVTTPDNLMGRILSSTLKGPKQPPGVPLKLEGTGLGYHLAASLMTQVQGELVVEVDASGGTRFDMHFPLETTTERYIEPGFMLGNELGWMDPGIGFTVVYVEDVKSHAMLVKQILSRMTDIKLLIADTGQKGLDLITLEKPDLVLLDMELPDMNGLQVFQELQQRMQTVGIPVVAISAAAMSHQISQAMDLGIRHYLSKPFSHRDLLDILREAQLEKAAQQTV